MMRADHDAAQRVARYMHAQQQLSIVHVGTGAYALVAVYDDGDRRLTWIGFQTESDAALFGAFQRQIMDLRKAATNATPCVHERALASIGFAFPQSPAPTDAPVLLIGYEVVSMTRAVPDHVLESLNGAQT